MIRRRVCEVPTCEERATARLIRHEARFDVCDAHAVRLYEETCAHHDEMLAEDAILRRQEEG